MHDKIDDEDIFFDFDGYFLTLLKEPPPAGPPPSSPLLWESSKRTVSLLHYLFRSVMILPPNRSEEMWQHYLGFSRRCLAYANAYTLIIEKDVDLPAPEWATFFHQEIADALRGEHPVVDRIAIRTTLDPRLYARSFPLRRTIEVSALTREYLRTLNAVVWAYVFAISEGVIALDEVDDIEFLEPLLPHFLSLHRDVNFSALPIGRARRDVMHMAVQTTRIQLTFILAHEYAHILLHSEERPSAATELEADEFAHELLMKLPWTYGSGDIWTALRWFFKLIALERVVGAVLYDGGDVDWSQGEVVEREGGLLRRIAHHPAPRRDNLLEITGTYLILKAKAHLRERGATWMQEYAAEYYERYAW